MKLMNCWAKSCAGIIAMALLLFIALNSNTIEQPNFRIDDMNINVIALTLAREQLSPCKQMAWIEDPIVLLDDPILREYLDNRTVYSVTGMDAGANPLFVNRPLLIFNRTRPKLLIEPADVAQYLTGLSAPVYTLSEAKRRLELFVIMSGYSMKEVHVLSDHHTDCESEVSRAWKFRCVLITDPQVVRVEEYTITIHGSGEFVVESISYISQRAFYL